ncbi:MAG: anaerobic ribonucleoside-triphosphate reductase activating protein, partial [Lachnospiraceae bacterium]|nr:anaerobic ribonucleoside-triphosphate reductase activating protein [Lachnospiraceae bacterium]
SAEPVMDEEELLSFLKKRQGLLDGVAITGGEPCLHRDLPDLIRRIRDLGYAVKLDTNGLHPDMLDSLISGGMIDYAAMDIKNSPEKYALTAGTDSIDMDAVYRSISILLEGRTDYEFRTTTVKPFHEAGDFARIGEMIRGARRYFIQCFTDRDTVPYGNLSAPTPGELTVYADIMKGYVEHVGIRGVDLEGGN